MRNVEWFVWLAEWVLQDGSYIGFGAGDVAEFAVGFGPNFGAATKLEGLPTAPHLGHVDNGSYSGTVLTVYVPDQVEKWAWRSTNAVDVGGFLAYDGIHDATVGDLHRVENGSFWVDEADYYEHFVEDPQLPPLIYTWQIMHIFARASGTHPLSPDQQVRFEPVRFTDPKLVLDAPVSDFLLRCQLLPSPPKRRSRERATTGRAYEFPANDQRTKRIDVSEISTMRR